MLLSRLRAECIEVGGVQPLALIVHAPGIAARVRTARVDNSTVTAAISRGSALRLKALRASATIEAWATPIAHVSTRTPKPTIVRTPRR